MPPSLIRRSLLGSNRLAQVSAFSSSFIAPPQSQSPSRSCTHVLKFRRTAATYRRHIKKLSIPPAPSFGPQKPTRRVIDVPEGSHIIFNPPPSAPNVYHTPLKFLPKNDGRRALYEDKGRESMYNLRTQEVEGSKRPVVPNPMTRPGTALHEIARSMPSSLMPRVPAGHHLPPPVREIKEKKYHLTPEQVAEMRSLRSGDSHTWTIDKLAEKFQCGTFFVRICTKNASAGMRHGARLEEVKKRWGRKKTMAREDRTRRKALWGRE